MARPDLDLARTQQWMLSVVVNTAPDVNEALRAPNANALLPASEISQVLLPSSTLTPAERLEIYHGMYPLRMVEVVESDYPALKHYVGDEPFAALVRAYVTAHPSTSPTLNRLACHLPEFVATYPGLRRPAFAAELARLEWAMAEVFEADESPVLDPDAIAAAGEDIADKRVRTIQAIRLLSLGYPVSEYWQSVRDGGHDHPAIRAKKSWLVVFRRSYGVRRSELNRDEHALLSALAGGETIGRAVTKTMASARRRLSPEDFFRWFRVWVQAGLFQSLF